MISSNRFYSIPILIIIWLGIISCNTDLVRAQEIKTKVESLLDEFNGNINYSINRVDVNSDRSVLVDLEFHEPYVLDPEHQDVLISYIVYRVFELQGFKEIGFRYYLDREKDFNVRTLKYNQTKLALLGEGYSNETLIQMMEYCFKNFVETDPIAINSSIEYLNRQEPKITYKLPFFELLVMFSKECSGIDSSDRASNTIVLMYAFERDVATHETHKRIPSLMKGLWEICGKEDLRTAERDLLQKMN